ncbi:hypothetical protein AAVH_17750 [Aphelenchoides avenae]|nr:hypothetical protein AAVH_17750 [Aphelenchus avenae]
MAEVKVRATAKLMRAGTADCERKYAIAFDASEDATAAALVQRLRSKEAFAGLSLAVEGVTVLDKDFDDYFEVDSADRLTHMGTYVVTFIDARSGRDERTVPALPYVAQKAIDDHLASTNGHPPEFAERKPTVRPPSTSDDDIILCEPTPNVAAQSSGPERKPETSQRHGLSAVSIHSFSLARPATAPPTSITSIAKASSTSGTDLDKKSRCIEPPLCKNEHISDSDAIAIRASNVRPPVVSRASTDRAPSTNAIAPIQKNPENLVAEPAAADGDNACSDEIGQGAMQMEWQEVEPIGAVSPKDEPTEAIPLNAILTTLEMERFAVAMQEPYRNSAELPTEPRSSSVDADQKVRVLPLTGIGRSDVGDDAEPVGSAPREGVVGSCDDESSERRRRGKRNPSRNVQDSRIHARTLFAGKKRLRGFKVQI